MVRTCLTNRSGNLSQHRAHELWAYCPSTGQFTSKRYKGKVVGFKTTAGYVGLEVDGVQMLAHRIAWLMVHGEFPQGALDHVDGDKMNNRISNLRIASVSENNFNAKAHADNSLGIKGVCPTGNGMFRAYVSCHGIMYQTYHKTQAKAEVWVKAKRAELHGAFCRHS